MAKCSAKTRMIVRQRDKVCQMCGTAGTKKNKLTIHHKKPRCNYPHLVDDPNNCTLWCVKCHEWYHKVFGVEV